MRHHFAVLPTLCCVLATAITFSSASFGSGDQTGAEVQTFSTKEKIQAEPEVHTKESRTLIQAESEIWGSEPAETEPVKEKTAETEPAEKESAKKEPVNTESALAESNAQAAAEPVTSMAAGDETTAEAETERREVTEPESQAMAAAEAAPQAVVAYSQRDYRTLLKIVQAEAGNCDNEGRVLVANVILNRVNSKSFPDTITDVVYERSQFSPVSNGSIDQVQVSDQTVACVNRALSGEDHSKGALYFMNRSISQKKNVSWFDRKLTYLFRHGSHEFFK